VACSLLVWKVCVHDAVAHFDHDFEVRRAPGGSRRICMAPAVGEELGLDAADDRVVVGLGELDFGRGRRDISGFTRGRAGWACVGTVRSGATGPAARVERVAGGFVGMIRVCVGGRGEIQIRDCCGGGVGVGGIGGENLLGSRLRSEGDLRWGQWGIERNGGLSRARSFSWQRWVARRRVLRGVGRSARIPVSD